MRISLNANGIAVRLDDLAMTLWMWHYSVAIGGVKLCVLDADVEQAVDLLYENDHDNDRVIQQDWQCPHCTSQVDGEWDICWRCGTDRQGLANEAFFHDPNPTNSLEKANGTSVVGWTALLSAVLFIATDHSLFPIFAWLMVYGYSEFLFWRHEQRETSETDPSSLPHCMRCEKPLNEEDINCGHCGAAVVDVLRRDQLDRDQWQAPEVVGDRRLKVGDSIALRAWQAAIIGYVCFPPLNFYSAWLLLFIGSKKLPVSRKHKTHIKLAWLINIFMIPVLLLVLVLISIGLSYEVFHSMGEYFDMTQEPQR